MTKKQYAKMDWEAIESIVYSDNDHPFDVLAPQKSGKDTLIQAFLPFAKTAEIVFVGKEDETVKMDMVDEDGFWAAFIPGAVKGAYCFRVTDTEGETLDIRNPYDFAPVIPKDSFEAFANGQCVDAYRVFGAHEMKLNGVSGVNFTVWAPNALRVSVIGAWNRWDGRVNPMQKLDEYGVFTMFIPGLKAGDVYRYEIKIKGNEILLKDDPYATKLNENGYSVVSCEDEFKWTENRQILKPRRTLISQPVNICRLSFADVIVEASKGRKKVETVLAEVVKSLVSQKYTHVSLLPVASYSKNKNDMYQTLFYYALDESIKESDLLKTFVNECHKNNINVLIDWSVSYFAKDSNGLEWFDGSNLYEHADKRLGYQPVYDANVFQYQRPEVKSFLLSNVMYWIANYRFDGLSMRNLESVLYLDYGRNEWACNAYGGKENLEFVGFVKELNYIIHMAFPDCITIADIDAVWTNVTEKNKDSLGFDFVWNNGFAKSLAQYVRTSASQRGNQLLSLLSGIDYAYDENFILPIGVDAMQDGILTGLACEDSKKASLMRAVYAYTMLYPGKKLIAMDAKNLVKASGSKKATDKNVYSFDAFLTDLNGMYADDKLFFDGDDKERSLEWIDHKASVNNVLTFIRKDAKKKEIYYVVANFSDTEYDALELVAPFAGKYEAYMCSEDKKYGGEESIADEKAVATEDKPYDATINTLTLKLASNCVTVYKYRPFTKKELEEIAEHKRQLRIAYVKAERAKIEKRRDEIIAEAIKDADARIKELEKLLEEK